MICLSNFSRILKCMYMCEFVHWCCMLVLVYVFICISSVFYLPMNIYIYPLMNMCIWITFLPYLSKCLLRKLRLDENVPCLHTREIARFGSISHVEYLCIFKFTGLRDCPFPWCLCTPVYRRNLSVHLLI